MEGLPSLMDSTFEALPENEKWNVEKMLDFYGVKSKAAIQFGLDQFVKATPWNSFESFDKLYCVVYKPKIAHNWMDDDVFALQRIQGTNPLAIKRVVSLPIPDFPVTTEMVKPLLRPNATLESELMENRLYIVDYSENERFETPDKLKPGKYLPSPRLLLYVNGGGKLMPLAIQVRSKPHPTQNPIFTPLHPKLDWLMAKIFYSAGEALRHQLGYHLFGAQLYRAYRNGNQ